MSVRTYTIEEQLVINSFKSELPHICYYCNKELSGNDIVTVDHKIPISRGGLTIRDNLAIACLDCNHEKDNMTEEEYNTYKQRQKEIQDTFEVNKAIKELLDVQNNILNRIKQVKDEYDKIDRQIVYLQQEMLFNNFNACEGYLYAKKLKELLNRKNELLLIKEEYRHLNSAIGNHSKQIGDIYKKVSAEVYNTSKPFVKRQIIGEPIIKKSNVVDLKSVVSL